MEIRKVGPEPPAWVLSWDALLDKKKKGREIGRKKIYKKKEYGRLVPSHLLGYFAGTA